jgi:hypothetical protein
MTARIKQSYFFDNNDLINGHAKHISDDDHVVDSRHGITAHPFENGLRSVKAAPLLNISDLKASGFDHVSDIQSRCLSIDHGHCKHLLSWFGDP